jgi:hypothetical protein
MQENKILKWSLILAIVIVANLFFNYSLSLIFNGPHQEDFCPFDKTSQVIQTKDKCEATDGIWNPGQAVVGGPEQTLKVDPAGYCDLYSKCNNAFQEASKAYEQKVFVALVIIGAIVLQGPHQGAQISIRLKSFLVKLSKFPSFNSVM